MPRKYLRDIIITAMDLGEAVDHVIQVGFDQDIIQDLAGLFSNNLLQLKALLLSPENTHRRPLLSQILLQLFPSPQLFEFSLYYLESFPLAPSTFPIISHLLSHRHNTQRILLVLLNSWNSNTLRVYCLQALKVMMANSPEVTLFSVALEKIEAVMPLDLDYALERVKVETAMSCHVEYFDALVEGVVEFILEGYQFEECRVFVFNYLLGLMTIGTLSHKILPLAEKFLKDHQNDERCYRRILQVVSGSCEVTELMAPLCVLLLTTNYKQYCNAVSDSISSLFGTQPTPQRLDSLFYLVYNVRLHLPKHRQIEILVGWLRLFQILIQTSPQRVAPFSCFLKITSAYLPLISRIKPINSCINEILIKNIPHSLETLLFFFSQDSLGEKCIYDLKDRLPRVSDRSSRQKLWKIYLSSSYTRNYTDSFDYILVNRLGLQCVPNWTVDSQRLIQLHQILSYQGNTEELAEIEALMEMISE